ncbi:hypothetical protein NAL19_3548 [Pectobacterium sp. F1-1]|nr:MULTISPECIES: hypothetical protein [Pectobacterium]UYA61605.1 hypothetical protein NAL19_3548 [Pectobacterium sp. F1-1]
MADNTWRYLVNVRPALAGWRWISLVARYYVNIFGAGNKGLLCDE